MVAAKAFCSVKRSARVVMLSSLLLWTLAFASGEAVLLSNGRKSEVNSVCSQTATPDDECEEQAARLEVDIHNEVNEDTDDTFWDDRYGVKQRIEGAEAAMTRKLVQDTIRYMKEEVFAKPEYAKIRDHCENKLDLCAFWAATGQCTENPTYMRVVCAPSCKTCHLLDYETRCLPGDPNAKDDLEPGGLSKLFQRIIDPQSHIAKYRPKLHFRPATRDGEAVAPGQENYKVGPWLVTFDSFLTEEECDRLVALAYKQGFDYEDHLFDASMGIYDYEDRPHELTYCTGPCYEDATTKAVFARMSNVTGMPVNNMEDFQVLKYEVGEAFSSHLDWYDSEKSHVCGPRIMTFFLYLTDGFQGGETHFKNLDGFTIVPKKGRAALWSNVLDHDLRSQDGRSLHESLPTKEGVKIAANAFVHLRDFITPSSVGCC